MAASRRESRFWQSPGSYDSMFDVVNRANFTSQKQLAQLAS